MTLSPRGFRIGLYEEHLDELAFLHGQAAALRADVAQGWQAPAPFEDRLEAHLDALVVGGALALEVAQARADAAEPDELFAIAALCCRRAEAAALAPLLQGAALDDAAKAAAIGHALLLEWPAAWQTAAQRALAQGEGPLAPWFAAVAACRGWPMADALASALRRAPPAQQAALLAWVGRVPGDAPLLLALLRPLFDAPDAAVRQAALRGGLRLHDDAAREQVLRDPAQASLLPLAAPRGAAPRLLEQLRGAETPPAAVQALGQLGELSAVRALTALLIAEPVAAEAARALHLITGGEPRETVLVPEPLNEDELSDKELAAWRDRGEPPRRADGEPFGDRVDRISQDPAVWGQWLVDNGARFQAGQRYRLGLPCTPEALLRSLAAPALPSAGRDDLADELLTRHGIALPWHPALPVATQWAAMRQAAPAAQAAGTAPGRWHWAGAPLAD
jgi:hypothetical protein